MKRLLVATWFCALAASSALQAKDLPFDFEVLRFRAKELAAQPYVPRANRVPKNLQAITYDQYRDIRFSPSHAWWRQDELPFQLQFFHPGFIYNKTVQVHQLEDGRESLIEFSTKLFDYGKNDNLGRVPGDVGFTGFRVHYPLNSPQYLDELVVFQGASYFRALGKGMRYGMSARGLALNTAEPGGEEFPVFEEFWVQKPKPNSKELTIYALLDSPSVTGAYSFVVKPGDETSLRVHAAVYPRAGANIKVFGAAPLTSMFWHGENSAGRDGDMRPEVHDSDGLIMERGNGEWIWRVLENPGYVRVSSFSDESPKGFGLVQRDRQYSSYEDLEAAYHLRPSTWVEPIGSWGRGVVRLVEIPTPDETNDNVVAFWVPEHLPAAGQALEFEYILHWFIEGYGGKKSPGGTVVATRTGHSKTQEPELQRFWVDFDGAFLRNRTQEAGIEAVVWVGSGGKLIHQSIQKNAYNGTWRVAFSVKPDGSKQPVELRCFLKRDPNILSETWSYLWNP